MPSGPLCVRKVRYWHICAGVCRVSVTLGQVSVTPGREWCATGDPRAIPFIGDIRHRNALQRIPATPLAGTPCKHARMAPRPNGGAL